jgi:hypothetical protein
LQGAAGGRRAEAPGFGEMVHEFSKRWFVGLGQGVEFFFFGGFTPRDVVDSRVSGFFYPPWPLADW